MKRIVMFFTCLVLAIQCFSQSSEITIQIGDTAEISFLNKVENKLLEHVKEIQQGKIKADILFYYHSPINKTNHWEVPLTLDQIKQTSLSKERIVTNKYELSAWWDSSMDTGYIVGFSRMYYHEYKEYMGGYMVPMGVYCYPLYEIPLSAYHAFLGEKEIQRLKDIIKNNFVAQLTDYDYYIPKPINLISFAPYSCPTCKDSTSVRTVMLSTGDSCLQQFSLSNWTHRLISMVKEGELAVFSDSLCKHYIGANKIMQKLQHYDTLVDIADKHLQLVAEVAPPFSASVFEKWSFCSQKKKEGYYPSPAMIFNRKIIALGINTGYDDGTKKQYYATLWLNYKQIESTPELNTGTMALYKLVIDSQLFKKLNVAYPKY